MIPSSWVLRALGPRRVSRRHPLPRHNGGMRWSWRSVATAARAAWSFTAAWFVASGLGASVVCCRSLDTPEYLIPYYLRDVRTRFKHYATHRKREGGEKCMTVEDFVRSVLVVKCNEPLDPAVVEDMTTLFAELDADKDACLSLTEFSFLMVLLTAKREDMRVLFSVLDKNRVGGLSLDEFAGVLRGLGCDAREALLLTRSHKNGFVRRLFGEERQRVCSFEEIAGVIDAVKEEIWTAEFRQHDTDRNDRITAEQFGKLIASHMIGSHVPFHMEDNIRKLHGSGETVTLDLWKSFNRVMQHADEITKAVEMFTSSGLSLRRKDFNRAVKAAGLPPFDDVELDLIMALFDRNADGVLEFDEFMSVMQQKLTYHYVDRRHPREKKNLPVRFAECVGEVFSH